MSEKSPIYDEIGLPLDRNTTEALQKLRQQSPSSPTSSGTAAGAGVAREPITTAAVTQITEEFQKLKNPAVSLYGISSFGEAQACANDHEYQSLIVDYVTEWEKIITERVDGELKHVRKLEADRRHYERKVEGLRQRTNELESKGKAVPKAQLDKLSRNEEKLKEAFTIHEREAGKLCALIEAVTHEGYKDLSPLVKNYLKWDINRVGREQQSAAQLSAILTSLSDKCGPTKTKKGNKPGDGSKTKKKNATKSSETDPAIQ
jgi:hypothetical protein